MGTSNTVTPCWLARRKTRADCNHGDVLHDRARHLLAVLRITHSCDEIDSAAWFNETSDTTFGVHADRHRTHAGFDQADQTTSCSIGSEHWLDDRLSGNHLHLGDAANELGRVGDDRAGNGFRRDLHALEVFSADRRAGREFAYGNENIDVLRINKS